MFEQPLLDHDRPSGMAGWRWNKAHRLQPDAIDIRVDVDPVHWFLNDKDDTRSSFYLEDAATAFQVQGLELDWIGVAWDGDLRFSDSGGPIITSAATTGAISPAARIAAIS